MKRAKLNRSEIIAALAVIVVLLVGVMQMRPNPDLLRFEVQGNRAYGYGFTDDRSIGVISKLRRQHPQVDTLVLMDMPGTRDADMNLQLARRIRKAGLKTHLQADSYIASGAVDLFLAGERRTMECGAKIGVHAWSAFGVLDAQEAFYDDRQKSHEHFLTEMGIDKSFYAFTRSAAPADGIYWLTATDIERFGLLSEAVECG